MKIKMRKDRTDEEQRLEMWNRAGQPRMIWLSKGWRPDKTYGLIQGTYRRKK